MPEKAKVRSDKNAVSVVELANKARETGNDEDKQLQAFRGMLASMFGIKRAPKKPETTQFEIVDTESLASEVAPADVITDAAPDSTNPANEVESDDPLAIDEPDERELPAWAKEAAPTGPVVDRAKYRSGNENDDDRRSSETRTLARRLAMTELREVANESARSALATHSQQKLRRQMWMDGTLACISLGMGGAYLTQESPQALWVTCGWAAVVIGVVAIIQLLRNFLGWQRIHSLRKAGGKRSVSRNKFEDKYRKYMKDQDRYGNGEPATAANEASPGDI